MYLTIFINTTLGIFFASLFLTAYGGKTSSILKENTVLFGSKTPIFLVTNDNTYEKYEYKDYEDNNVLHHKVKKREAYSINIRRDRNNPGQSHEFTRRKRQALFQNTLQGPIYYQQPTYYFDPQNSVPINGQGFPSYSEYTSPYNNDVQFIPINQQPIGYEYIPNGQSYGYSNQYDGYGSYGYNNIPISNPNDVTYVISNSISPSGQNYITSNYPNYIQPGSSNYILQSNPNDVTYIIPNGISPSVSNGIPPNYPNYIQPGSSNGILQSDANQDPHGNLNNEKFNGYSNPSGPNSTPASPSKHDDGESNDIPNDSSNNQDIVYPEILVVVDYETFRYHGSDPRTVVKFVAALYHGYDLRFRQITSPKIHLNIAGIVIAKTPMALPYAYYGTGISTQTLDNIQRYFSSNIPQFYREIHYDLINVMLYRESITNKLGADQAAGYALMGAACKTVVGPGVALTKNSGGVESITIGVHELTHAFGAPHDGPESTYGTGGYCPEGNLMQPVIQGANSMLFSSCSIRSMQKYFRSSKASCLRNRPAVGKLFKKILPGKIQTRDEQCKTSMGNLRWHSEGDQSCREQMCSTRNSLSSSYNTAKAVSPAEGTPCGNGRICLNGECVPEK